MFGTKFYSVWNMMLQRCFNPKVKNYHRYGGRGITVCPRWMKFEGFRDDMLATYQQGLTIERKDNNGDYCPENCTWVDQATQQRNRRNNVFLEFNGQRLTMADWERKLSLPESTLSTRIKALKWTPERALSTPVRPLRRAQKV